MSTPEYITSAELRRLARKNQGCSGDLLLRAARAIDILSGSKTTGMRLMFELHQAAGRRPIFEAAAGTDDSVSSAFRCAEQQLSRITGIEAALREKDDGTKRAEKAEEERDLETKRADYFRAHAASVEKQALRFAEYGEAMRTRVAALEGAARVVCREFYQQHPLIKALSAALSAPPAPATCNDPLQVGAVKESLTTAVSQAAADVLAERRRQIEAEGWTPEHDDQHANHELAIAAACYAAPGAQCGLPVGQRPRNKILPFWPWSRDWWKPTDRRRDLVKAGALILAEIERLDRAAQAEPEG